MARLVSSRGACVRRKTGCVLVDRNNHVLATGYNGRATGVRNCLDLPCHGEHTISGIALDDCEAIHAEANALLQCTDVNTIVTAYCTDSPCIHCVKLLMNTSCGRIMFLEPYSHDRKSKELWFTKDRAWIHYEAQ
jgi:dCMP deaminase